VYDFVVAGFVWLGSRISGKSLHAASAAPSPHPLLACILIVLSVASAPAAAQSYRCSAGGQNYYSDRPCNASTRLQSYGPAPTYPRYTPTLPGVSKAQDHVKYLSSGCASISEAIRTGPARGVRSDVIQGLQEEYRQKCAVEDQDARAQAQRDANVQRQAQVAERQQGAVQKQQAAELAARCSRMRDVISLRRKREAELNAKEVDALRALERTYNEVCLAS